MEAKIKEAMENLQKVLEEAMSKGYCTSVEGQDIYLYKGKHASAHYLYMGFARGLFSVSIDPNSSELDKIAASILKDRVEELKAKEIKQLEKRLKELKGEN